MPEKSSVAKIAEPFVCGGSAATFASIVIHPMDLAKVRMQLYGQLNPGKPVPSFVELLSSMIKTDGIASVYKGVDAAVGRQLVYGTARIGLHRAISDKLKEYNEGKPISFMMKTLSGMASGSIAVCIGTPCKCCVLWWTYLVCLVLDSLLFNVCTVFTASCFFKANYLMFVSLQIKQLILLWSGCKVTAWRPQARGKITKMSLM
jgi:hypothetical protein